jgi:hypothetical protein
VLKPVTVKLCTAVCVNWIQLVQPHHGEAHRGGGLDVGAASEVGAGEHGHRWPSIRVRAHIYYCRTLHMDFDS